MRFRKKKKLCDEVILHWWHILNLVYAENLAESDMGNENCAFCRTLWATRYKGCADCPISVKTGVFSCKATPYYDVIDAFAKNDNKCLISHVEDELRFLEGICDEWLNTLG
jgi:hypothetical protein